MNQEQPTSLQELISELELGLTVNIETVDISNTTYISDDFLLNSF